VATDVTGLVDVAMPRLSDSMEEATVLQWLKSPGDEVAKGEPLVEVETDKATIVYEAEAAGRLEEILVAPGNAAALGEPIARLRVTDGAAAPPPAVAASHPAVPASGAPGTATPAPSPPVARGTRARATPVARALAAALGVPLDGVSGTGLGGRIVRADVRALAPADGGAPSQTGGRGAATELRHTPTQRTIADRMTESRATVPEFTLESEISMEAAKSLRAELQATAADPVPSYNDLVVRAAALSLREFPALNAAYVPGGSVRYERINVGIAVDAGDALLVPTIYDADRLSVLEIAGEARRLAEAARNRTLAPADLADGTFTVSNLGMLGVRRFHAVINAPQAAILTVGEVSPRAVVDDGAVVVRTMMEVALSCDHRVVYGAEAARFLQRLRHLLEHPVALVVETQKGT
jgi:pyruvate dehydrogenase E2 component (dihydrolipoamide acetyltransferase)